MDLRIQGLHWIRYMKQITNGSNCRIEEEEIQTARFGDYKYFLTKETEDDGSVLLQYFIVKNGILYMFQYDADTDDDYYPVLEQTLSTVDYAVEG